MKFKTLNVFVLLVLIGCTKIPNQKNVRVSAPDVDAAEPVIAATNSQILVAWVEHGVDKSANIFLQKFDVDGKSNGAKVRVNPDEGTATAWRGDPPTIAVGADSAIYLGWTARVDSADGHAADIVLSVSRDGGQSFAAPVKVNDDKAPAVHGMHSLAIDERGRIYVAWLDERYLKKNAAEIQTDAPPNEFHDEKAGEETPHDAKPMQHSEANREVYWAVSSDGGKTFAPNKKLAGDVCPCCKTALLATADNRIYAAWRQVLAGDFRHVAVAASADGGENFAAPVIVSDDRWQIAGCPVSGAGLATSGAKNTLQVVWFTAGASGTTGVYRAESTDAGKTFAPRELVSAGAVFGTPVLLSNAGQNLAAVWSANDKIMMADLANVNNKDELGAGELPSAARVAGKSVAVAFVKKENDNRSVWLSLTGE